MADWFLAFDEQTCFSSVLVNQRNEFVRSVRLSTSNSCNSKCKHSQSINYLRHIEMINIHLISLHESHLFDNEIGILSCRKEFD